MKKNYKIITLKLLIIYLFSTICVFASMPNDELGRPLYMKGAIYVKIKAKSASELKNSKTQSVKNKFGLASLDALSNNLNIKTVKKSFNLSPKLDKKVQNRIKDAEKLPDLSTVYTVEFDSTFNVMGMVEFYSQDPSVEYAEPIPMAYSEAIPNDPSYSKQRFLSVIQAEQAWEIFKAENSTEPILIGICDSGVQWDHPDLLPNLYQNLKEDANGNGTTIAYINNKWVLDPGDLNGIDDDGNGYVDDLVGWNFYTDDGSIANQTMINPGNTHGTHVAGLAAGVTDNGIGISSIAWNVKFLPSKHCNINSSTSIYNGYNGIAYLAEMGADVINCSWGGSGYSKTGEDVVRYANGLGSIIVVAAGNNNNQDNYYPAMLPKVVTVAALDTNKRKSYYSNYGQQVALSSPGGDAYADGALYCTVPVNSYSTMQGTSMASPVVAGLFGFVKAYHPDWTNEQIINQVLGTCDNISSLNSRYDNKLGAGCINAYRVLTETNVEAPKELKLSLKSVIQTDEEGYSGIGPGETGFMGFELRNFSLLTETDRLDIVFSTSDPDIIVYNSTTQCSVPASDEFSTPLNIKIKIKTGAKPHTAKCKITLSCSDAKVINDEISFDLVIGESGILVVDNGDKHGTSGVLISEFLKYQGFDVVLTNTLPNSLYGYQAVFLNCGAKTGQYASNFYYPDNLGGLTEYLKDGGKLYIEGGDVYFHFYDNAPIINSLLGINYLDDGPSSRKMGDLVGQKNSIMKNINSACKNNYYYTSPDVISSDGKNGIVAFDEVDVGAVAVQNIGDYGQKTYSTVYPLVDLKDVDQTNNKYEILYRIANYLDLNIDKYVNPDFNSDKQVDIYPAKIKFYENSFKNTQITSWAWDFNNDGVFDSFKQEPEWTYSEPGRYSVTLIVTANNKQYAITKDNYITVTNGENGLEFKEATDYAYVNPDPTLNFSTGFTYETWIHPASYGFIPIYGYGYIFSKRKCGAMLFSGNNLMFFVTNNAGSSVYLTTPKNSITYNKGNHIAITYNGNGEFKIYINGVEQVINYYPQNSTIMKSDLTDTLYVGNYPSKTRAFDGYIDEMRVWNYVRSQSEIQNNMYKNLKADEAGLSAYWSFDEPNVPVAEDLSPNDNWMYINSARWAEGWDAPNPEIITKTPVIACLGEDALLSAIAQGDNNFVYQWQKDGVNIDGATEPLLYLTDCKFETSANYRCRMRNVPGGKILVSDEMLLYVVGNTKITKQPETQYISLKGRAVFSFEAHTDNKPPDFEPEIQWYKGNTALVDNDRIAGSKSSILSIRNIQSSDLGDDYYVVVTGKCGAAAVSEHAAIINVDLSITENPKDRQVCTNYPATFGIEVSYSGDLSTLSYQWYFNGTKLNENAKYSGTDSKTLVVNNITAADEGQYYAVVTLNNSNIQVMSDYAELTVLKPVSVTKYPSYAWFKQGNSGEIKVEVVGTEPMTFTWYKDGDELDYPSMSIYTVTNAQSDIEGEYYCRISNACGSVTTDICYVTVTSLIISDVSDNESVHNFEIVPNPTNDLTSVRFKIDEPGDCNIYLTDIYGRRVAELLNKYLDTSDYSINFSAKLYNLSSGTYFLTIRTGKSVLTRRLLVIK